MLQAYEVEVVETDEYNRFEFSTLQREVSNSQVKKFEEAIAEFGYLEHETIKVYEKNDKYVIVDGQHRFLACKNLGRAFTYVVIDESEAEKYMRIANMNGSLWSVPTFIQSYSKDNPDYRVLKQFIERNRLNIHGVNRIFRQGTNLTKRIKHGKFVATEGVKVFLDEMTTRYQDVQDLPVLREMPEILQNTSFICAACTIINHPLYDIKLFRDKFDQHALPFIKRYGTVKDYLAMFEAILNRKRKTHFVSFTLPVKKLVEQGLISQRRYEQWQEMQPLVIEAEGIKPIVRKRPRQQNLFEQRA